MDKSILEARALYTDLRQHGRQGWGPFTTYNDQMAQSELIRRVEALIAKTCIVYSDPRTLWFASPWHAFLFLHLMHQKGTQGASPRHLLFRGQSDPDKRIVSTLDRLPPSTQRQELAATLLFSAYLWRRLRFDKLCDESYAGAARHYGFASKLIDFTPDPAVAIFFANLDIMPHCPDGRVFGLPVPKAIDCGMRVLIPPPFVEPVYRQLGVFLHPGMDTRLDLTEKCFSIRFRKAPRNLPFVVVRDGTELDLTSVHPWIRDSASWARARALREPSLLDEIDDVTPIVEEGMRTIPPAPVSMHCGTLKDQARWAFQYVDFLYWLCIFISLDGCRTSAPEAAVRPILRDNRGITELAIAVLRTFRQACPDVRRHHIEELLEPMLEAA